MLSILYIFNFTQTHSIRLRRVYTLYTYGRCDEKLTFVRRYQRTRTQRVFARRASRLSTIYVIYADRSCTSMSCFVVAAFANKEQRSVQSARAFCIVDFVATRAHSGPRCAAVFRKYYFTWANDATDGRMMMMKQQQHRQHSSRLCAQRTNAAQSRAEVKVGGLWVALVIGLFVCVHYRYSVAGSGFQL